MLSTLKQALKSLTSAQPQTPRQNVADGLLGKYRDILPEGKSSTEFVRELRDSRYGKVK